MNNDYQISIDNVSMRFNLANQKVDNLKEYVIKLIKKELFFKEFMALTDVNLHVRKGESWAIVGRNGAGKSTLLKLICGILKPYSGTIQVNGNVAPLLELGAGFDGRMTARENIYLNGAVLGYSKGFMQEKFNEIVSFSELQDFLDVPLINYSSGMRARLGFAVATIVHPEILIVDEVLAVGDAKFQVKCETRMQELLSGGTTLLYVSHSIAQVKRLCQNALWLDQGHVVMSGLSEDVCKEYEKL